MSGYGPPAVQALREGDPAALGPYRIAGRLGQGGMGTVFLAEGPQGPVALKVIMPHLAADPEFVERFRREVAAARRVRRFCTAPVLDSQLDVPPFWVVTEYVAGPDLGRVLRESGPLANSNLEALAVGVATALTAIHGAGLVHCDLKPGNVLLSPLGPRVIDFGIARAFDIGGGKTVTGRLLGTPEYMAPEVINAHHLTPAADIFAWGCVVYAAATGRSPFAARTVPEALMRVVNDRPSLEAIEPGLREVVAAALEKEPRNRPTAQDIASRLVGSTKLDAEALAGTLRIDLASLSGVPASAPGHTPAPPRKGGRGKLAAIGAGVAALLVAVAVGAAVWGLPKGPPATDGVLYQDLFDDKESGWNTDAGGAYDDAGGTFTLTNNSDNPSWARPPLNAVIPQRVLLEANVSNFSGDPGARAGLYCNFLNADTAEGASYDMEIRRDGRARIRKSVSGDGWDLTADVPVEGFKPDKAKLQAECTREGDKVRLALWVNGRLAVQAEDSQKLPTARQPTLGVQLTRGLGENEAKVTVEDFTVSHF
ncbi:serine/threonine-protein kinase [Thermoactinospora rubra]|uniref:serine/threonine-protein kinase n=1 Tax=Thermoactinospora rubra TaxID=1088767 RepID=UPI000A0F5BFC|nr:serine/threonine-protein kinase [Thermoactinospora rubra]